MRGYSYTFTNNFTGQTFSIGLDEVGNEVCQSYNGLLLQEYPVFEAEIRNEEQDRAGQHGIWDFFSFYGKRNVTLSGVILASSWSNLVHLQNLVKETLSLPAQPIQGTNDGYVNLKWTDAQGIEWNMNVKLTQDLQFSRPSGNRLRSTFFISLKSDSPYILSTTEYSEAYYRGWRQGSMPLPAYLPAYVNTVYNEVVNIYQAGTGDSPGTYRVYGPATNPVLTKLTENFASETVISDFTDTWTGGTVDTEHSLIGGQALKLTSIAGAQATATITKSLDLTGGEFISGYFYVDDPENFAYGEYTVGENYIKFIETDGVDEFVAELYLGNRTLGVGWNYFYMRKSVFNIIGTPSWGDISKIELSIKAKGTTDLNVTFDDFRNRDITYNEVKLELTTTLLAGEYVDFNIATGAITKEDGSDLSTYLTSDSQWYYVSPKQNLFIYESDGVSPLSTGVLPRVYADPVSETDLTGYWHFDDADTVTAIDYVGSNNGAITGANPAQGADQSGLLFNGASGDVKVTDTAIFQNIFDGGGSVSGWFKPLSDGENNEGHIITKGEWSIYIEDEAAGFVRLKFKKTFSGTDGEWRTTRTIPVGEVITFILTYNDSAVGNNPILYLGEEGAVEALAEVSTPVGVRVSDIGSDLYFGNNSANTRTFDGMIDELRTYSSIVTAAYAVDLAGQVSLNKYIDQVSITWNDAIL